MTAFGPYATEVHVVGSFYGFEALLVGRPVVTHGQPFYAGFGWTKDLTLSAPICEQDFQYAALIALFGNNLTAPYTGETLSPDQALALHHLWLRSDFSYFFEQMAHKLGKDERYQILDLRRKYYHTIDLQRHSISWKIYLVQILVFCCTAYLIFAMHAMDWINYLPHCRTNHFSNCLLR